jgi:hypothetical protein
MHNAIKQGLQAAGIGLVPLMLVQVANSNKAVDEARTRLAAMGVQESKIAWYTADDPNDDLLSVAIDERKEVLIFKVAVALGFDAPRAFTLVSMRGAKDTDFGIQVVGRILRVHAPPARANAGKETARAAALRLCVFGRCGQPKWLGACGRKDQRDSKRVVAGMPVHHGGEGGRDQRNSGVAQRAGAIAGCALHAASVAHANNRTRTLPLTVCHLRASRLPGNRQEF